jgi:hypothetical protein
MLNRNCLRYNQTQKNWITPLRELRNTIKEPTERNWIGCSIVRWLYELVTVKTV